MIVSPLETDRLRLHPLRVDHAVEMAQVLADSSLYELTGGAAPPTVAELERRYRLQTAGANEPGERWCNWVIRTRHDQRAVGFVQATVVGPSADVAWTVGRRDQGRGFATEAAEALCEWLGENGVDQIEAHIHPRHRASQTVAIRLGLTLTGAIDDDGEEIWSATTASRTC